MQRIKFTARMFRTELIKTFIVLSVLFTIILTLQSVLIGFQQSLEKKFLISTPHIQITGLSDTLTQAEISAINDALSQSKYAHSKSAFITGTAYLELNANVSVGEFTGEGDFDKYSQLQTNVLGIEKQPAPIISLYFSAPYAYGVYRNLLSPLEQLDLWVNTDNVAYFNQVLDASFSPPLSQSAIVSADNGTSSIDLIVFATLQDFQQTANMYTSIDNARTLLGMETDQHSGVFVNLTQQNQITTAIEDFSILLNQKGIDVKLQSWIEQKTKSGQLIQILDTVVNVLSIVIVICVIAGIALSAINSITLQKKTLSTLYIIGFSPINSLQLLYAVCFLAAMIVIFFALSPLQTFIHNGLRLPNVEFEVASMVALMFAAFIAFCIIIKAVLMLVIHKVVS